MFNSESCWLVSVDGAEATPTQWQVLEKLLAAKRKTEPERAEMKRLLRLDPNVNDYTASYVWVPEAEATST